MSFEKFGENIEKTSAESPEKNVTQIESMDDFIKSLEDVESNSPYDKTEISPVMKPEVRDDVPGFEGRDVLVCGSPMETGEKLNYEQGDNIFGAKGNCGLVSVSNVLNLCGHEKFNENVITLYAIENNECNCGFYFPDERGGTNPQNIKNILDDFGIKSEIIPPYEDKGSIESVAESLEKGHVGIMGVNSAVLWDDPDFYGDGYADHAVTLTGTVRDGKTGELLALTICDSGNGESCHVVPIDKLEDCYEFASNSAVILSKEPVREI